VVVAVGYLTDSQSPAGVPGLGFDRQGSALRSRAARHPVTAQYRAEIRGSASADSRSGSSPG
jgi:hypothetical protein